ncbi:probable leucine-rich repeat receptor-like serine/threonine-protein kinase At3g14840 [Cornus florida]|uniref:probable leucine-rich repeat receptor-like serine/threonine-protein kinase At3g14840 n=1 Tax=Cornus florida TaxID=4283 RepID=UPI0028A0B74E|nr:probable leucine-rich repeat receptor-like serine/threonine-protein kinase At3g14840 [Cornus florida]
MFFSRRRLTSSVIVLICLATFASGEPTLPTDEVELLKEVAKTLGKTDWNFSVNPCNIRETSWVSPENDHYKNNVTCNCTISNDGVCHVVSIVLKGQSLSGKLPPELARFRYLQEIDLTRNFLYGTIPPEWGSMQLKTITMLGNRLTGSIPKEIGNITTLNTLVLEFNQLSGDLPSNLGSLPLIEKMFLSSNNFSGELPGTFESLTTLKDFRINENNFTGKIPNFIQRWTTLEKLFIQASGLDGPIPFEIFLLGNLSELRISDLSGSETPFPPRKSNSSKMKILILRSCNITGQIPVYIGEMTTLDTLDLSFNRLSGEIPSTLGLLSTTDYIYLTGNLLNGSNLAWTSKVRNVDLSYNNFTLDQSAQSSTCQKVNLFSSSSAGNTPGNVACMRSFVCKRRYSSFHINCGGEEVTVDKNTIYEGDDDEGGPSFFSQSRGGTNWAFSNTGHFLGNNLTAKNYIWTSASTLFMKNSKLYMTARLSPLSLTYYGFCLRTGNYTVGLHFAEIMFTDKNYSSLGRRIFDIYLQRERVLKDFNIESEAGGVGKAIVKNFTAAVTNGTLEIRFYWAGKGTTDIPEKGVYGPLISAISVDREHGKSLSAGAVAGIVVAVVASITFLILGILWWKGCLRLTDTMDQDLKGLDLPTGTFTLRQIKAATNNFDVANKIGEGGFGPVYKGLLSDGTRIAVKQLSSKSKQGNREFVNEIGMISALQHPHLVKLYGCCIEENQLLLVYEYMENNSLFRALLGTEELQLKLDWPTRQKICIGIARGLAYLHEESRLKIVHRDIKATNVLLDKDFNPKISDFGLARLHEEDSTHISTRIAGTYGYMAPEYAMRGYLTDKADVYSFGVVTLEIVSGRNNTSHGSKGECFNLLDWALELKEKGDLLELVDPRLGPDFNKEEVLGMIKIALLCTDVSSAVRPTMSSVVSMLEGRAIAQELIPGAPSSAMNVKEMKDVYQHSHETDLSKDSLIQSMSVDEPWTASSTSTADLYPVNLNSDYLVYRN